MEADFAGKGAIFGELGVTVARDLGAFVAALTGEVRAYSAVPAIETDLDVAEFDVAGGNRQANAALYRIVVTRMRIHQTSIDYVARRTKEGKTKPEIMRCLKRYVAREVFRLLRKPDLAAPDAT